MVNRTKCDSCLNSRVIISENGYHSTCCLSDKKAIDCLMNKEDYYIGEPKKKDLTFKKKENDMARCDDCKANKVCDHNRFGFENCGNFIPADVVPKSEVDDLRKKLDKTEVELMNVCLDKTNCDDMIQYILDFYFKRKAAEVFAEIENALSDNFHADCQMGDCIEDYYDDNLRDDIAELKKKYTEEQNK